MGFFTERCPNCGKSNSKQAEFCNSCGCPSASGWSTCTGCGASVGADSQFCWKCGVEQNQEVRRQIYEDRWRRSPTDFAVQVSLSVPEKVLLHGLQVDEGTLGLLFQDGHYVGSLEPGYHSFTNFFTRLTGLDKGKEAHAVLVDMNSAEVDFTLEGLHAQNQTPIDVRVRLLFRVTDTKLFVERLLQNQASFSTLDLANAFQVDVREGLQALLRDKTVTGLMSEFRVREMMEGSLGTHLQPILFAYGLTMEGVRLAEFGGEAINTLREKFGEIEKLNREYELNRKLNDALRKEKLTAYRDEEEARDAYEQITHEYGFRSADREQERKLFIQAAETRVKLEALRQDYSLRRAEIVNRLDEQELRHRSELADVSSELSQRSLRFEADMKEQGTRFHAGLEQQVYQAKTDLEVAKQGIEALKLVKETKLEARAREEALNNQLEGERLKMRGDASLQALLATVSGEHADRLLKLAELEMRKGLSAEQALALVAEKSPEIAPSVAEALKAKYSQPPPEKPAS
jgi:hypothetical protein